MDFDNYIEKQNRKRIKKICSNVEKESKKRDEILAPLGKNNEVRDYILKKIYTQGENVKEMDFPKKWKEVYNFTEEMWGSYVKYSSIYNLTITFGKEMMNLSEDELTNSWGSTKALNCDEIREVVQQACFCLEGKGYVTHGPADMLWGGEYFLTKEGERKAEEVLNNEVTLVSLVENRIPKESIEQVRKLIEEKIRTDEEPHYDEKAISKAIRVFEKEYTCKFCYGDKELVKRDAKLISSETFDVVSSISAKEKLSLNEILEMLSSEGKGMDRESLLNILFDFNRCGFINHVSGTENPIYSIAPKGKYCVNSLYKIARL